MLFLQQLRDVSSVGSERLLDRQEVDSSNLSRPTFSLIIHEPLIVSIVNS